MSETFRPRDEFERADLGSLIRKISDLVDVLGKIAPADMISRPSSQASPQDASAVVEGEEESKPKRRSRKREAPESPASPYDLAKLLGVNLGGPRGQRGEYLSPSPPSSFVVSPSGAGPRDPGSFDNPIDVTPKLNAPPSPAGLPAPSSNLPAPIGPSAVDHALTPGRLDRIAVDFVDSVLDAIDIKQRMSAAAFSGNGGRNSGGGWGPGGPGGPNGPFQATNYRSNTRSAAGGGGGRRGGGPGGRNGFNSDPFSGGAWNWFRRTAGRTNSKFGFRFRRGFGSAKKGVSRILGAGGFGSVGFGKFMAGFGMVATAAKELTSVIGTLKNNSEKQFQSGRYLSAYNGGMAATYAAFDISESFRNRRLAAGTSETFKTLGRSVSFNRESQTDIDIFSTNIKNRVAIAGSGLISGFNFIAGQMLKPVNNWMEQIDPGGKSTEEFFNQKWRKVLGFVDQLRRFKPGDPNSWLSTWDAQQKAAQQNVMFDFNSFIQEAKNQKPLRANLQIKL